MNLSVTAIGHDRPGIVAAITGALLEMDGNVDDSQMSILHGQFAVMLIVSVPDSASVDELSLRLEEVGREFGLAAITVSPVSVASALIAFTTMLSRSPFTTWPVNRRSSLTPLTGSVVSVSAAGPSSQIVP